MVQEIWTCVPGSAAMILITVTVCTKTACCSLLSRGGAPARALENFTKFTVFCSSSFPTSSVVFLLVTLVTHHQLHLKKCERKISEGTIPWVLNEALF